MWITIGTILLVEYIGILGVAGLILFGNEIIVDKKIVRIRVGQC